MQPTVVALPAYHPRVLNVSYRTVSAVLVPRYVAGLSADATIPQPTIAITDAATRVLLCILKLLVRHQGDVPVGEAVRFILNGDKPGELIEARAKVGARLLELVIECSELIKVDSSGSTFSLHPEWSKRFCARYEAQESRILEAIEHRGPQADRKSLMAGNR